MERWRDPDSGRATTGLLPSRRRPPRRRAGRTSVGAREGETHRQHVAADPYASVGAGRGTVIP